MFVPLGASLGREMVTVPPHNTMAQLLVLN